MIWDAHKKNGFIAVTDAYRGVIIKEGTNKEVSHFANFWMLKIPLNIFLFGLLVCRN